MEKSVISVVAGILPEYPIKLQICIRNITLGEISISNELVSKGQYLTKKEKGKLSFECNSILRPWYLKEPKANLDQLPL